VWAYVCSSIELQQQLLLPTGLLHLSVRAIIFFAGQCVPSSEEEKMTRVFILSNVNSGYLAS
jgi:hypothetical protein